MSTPIQAGPVQEAYALGTERREELDETERPSDGDGRGTGGGRSPPRLFISVAANASSAAIPATAPIPSSALRLEV